MTRPGRAASDHWHGIRHRLHELLEAGHPADFAGNIVDFSIVALIILNVLAFSLGTVDAVAQAYGDALELFNAISVLVFTIEYALRLWVCVELPAIRHLPGWRARLRFARRPLMIIDLAAILPFYLSFLLPIDLRVLRVLRLLRFFKLGRYSPALQTLGRVVANEHRALFGAAIVMISMLLIASTLIYFLEHEVQPEVFGNVPQAAWWALATLTTVGYGDVVPVTPLGKLFGGLVMIFGLGMFAIPIGILATGFSQEINRREFVVTWSMVARMPLFAHLDARAIANVVNRLRAQTFPAGAVIVREGERTDALHFVAAGEVVLEVAGKPVVLESGDFFGEHGLLEPGTSSVRAASALTKCDLLILDRRDFEELMRESRELRAHVHAVMRARDRGGRRKRGRDAGRRES